MKKLRFLSIFLVTALLTGLFSTVALAAPEDAAAAPAEPFSVAAKAALLVDGKTGQVLYEQNADAQLYPASITKVMTTLLVLQAIDEGKLSLDQTITASQSAINMLTADSSTAGIKVGEQLTVEQLLYCVMVKSANEACYILAEAVSGTTDAFVKKMNEEAKRLGCENTNYVNPCGIHDPQHYTSAHDIYVIAKEAMKYNFFMTLADTKLYKLPATNMSEERVMHTTNFLLDQWRAIGYLYPYAHGIKTGHTSDAGYCLVSSAEKGERSLISVILGAQAVKNGDKTDYQSFSETKRMFEWGFSNFRQATILDHATLVDEVPVTLSRMTNYVSVHPAEDVQVLLPVDLSVDDLVEEVTIDAESVEAPVAADQQLGSITVKNKDGLVYATVPLVASNEVPASAMLTAMHKVKVFFSNPLVKIAAVVLVILIIVLIVHYFRHRRPRYRGGQSFRTRSRNRRYRGRRR